VKETLISTPIFDPFQYSVELPHEIVLHPLGCEMHLQTNSREIVRAAEESWSGFPALFDGPPMDLRVAVSPISAPSLEKLLRLASRAASSLG
jgi:hypothetical protein